MQTVFFFLGSIYLTIRILNACCKFRADPTDNRVTGQKSGLIYYKDYGTGIEYVGTLEGGLTVRQLLHRDTLHD